MNQSLKPSTPGWLLTLPIGILMAGAMLTSAWYFHGDDPLPPHAPPAHTAPVAIGRTQKSSADFFSEKPSANADIDSSKPRSQSGYVPRRTRDSSGFFQMAALVKPWPRGASLEEVGQHFRNAGFRIIEDIDGNLALQNRPQSGAPNNDELSSILVKVLMFNYEGQPEEAYQVLEETRQRVENNDELAHAWLFTIIHLQGLVSLRRGETENCIMCRGESSCIIPIVPAAVHTIPAGSRQAIVHFTEYLAQFPEDYEMRWLLNLAHMTLGEHPHAVDPRYVLSLDRFRESEFDVGKFRDIGHQVGVNRFNQSGGAIMEDFDNDGHLDLVATSIDPNAGMGLYRNSADGKFVDCTAAADLSTQTGGLNCGQADYNHDGLIDIFIPRGAWFKYPVRCSLLQNNGDGTFTDVTAQAGLLDPVNSNSAAWADYDNDGWLDLFIACERQPNRLYHNEGNGTFLEVAKKAGVDQDSKAFCKAGVWFDFDNDDYPDLFLNNLESVGRLFHNNRNGAFSDVSQALGIDGPQEGFPCLAFDYDNDGWLDLFATSYFRSVEGVVKGMLGEPFNFSSNRLFHNNAGLGFEDQTRSAGLDLVLATMGCNYGDFDNDGYLDMYLGTGAPGYEFLVPNRMFKNVAGVRFSDVTGTSRTGHLQKGHGVACGDWDRDGNVDIFIQLGGPAIGDKSNNVLFQNPGHANRWLTVKLAGTKTNRQGVGARIKIITEDTPPLTIHRHVSSGSSFGANPLEQTIGLGPADRVALLEIHWPTSGTTQVFRDLAVNQFVEVIETATTYRTLNLPRISLPEKGDGLSGVFNENAQSDSSPKSQD